MSPQHIGVFDSGEGGALTTRYLQQKFPRWHFTFYADHANAPYGSKSPSELLQLAQNMVHRLQSEQVSKIVVACHSICSNIFPELLAWSSIPLISVNESLLQGLQRSNPQNIAIVATTATIQSGWWQENMQKGFPQAKSWFQDCPGLATAIDQDDQQQIDKEVKECQLKIGSKSEEIDTVALACTHYPAALSAFEQYFPVATIIDARQELPSLLRKK